MRLRLLMKVNQYCLKSWKQNKARLHHNGNSWMTLLMILTSKMHVSALRHFFALLVSLYTSQAYCLTISFKYDAVDRLSGVTYNLSAINYRYDAAGNRLGYLGVVTNDNTAPTISIATPTTGPSFATTNSFINLTGTAVDDTEITWVTWANGRGGIGTAHGTSSWSASAIPLQRGDNTILITVYDTVGKTNTAELLVSFSPTPSDFTITLSTSPPLAGTVVGAGIFAAGASQTVVATPNSGFTFLNWTESGNVVSAASSYGFTLDADRILVANFAPTEAAQFSAVRLNNDVFEFTLSGRPGATYLIQASENLSDWTDISFETIPQAGPRLYGKARQAIPIDFTGPYPHNAGHFAAVGCSR